MFINQDYRIDIHSFKDMCEKIYIKVSTLFEHLKERIDILDQKGITNEDIVVKQHKEPHFKDMEL